MDGDPFHAANPTAYRFHDCIVLIVRGARHTRSAYNLSIVINSSPHFSYAYLYRCSDIRMAKLLANNLPGYVFGNQLDIWHGYAVIVCSAIVGAHWPAYFYVADRLQCIS